VDHLGDCEGCLITDCSLPVRGEDDPDEVRAGVDCNLCGLGRPRAANLDKQRRHRGFFLGDLAAAQLLNELGRIGCAHDGLADEHGVDAVLVVRHNLFVVVDTAESANDGVVGYKAAQSAGRVEVYVKGLEVAVVDADGLRAELDCDLHLFCVLDLD